MDAKNSIEIRSISKKFDIKRFTAYGGTAKSGTKQVIADLSLTVQKGEVVGIVGRNGSGKSTLLKLIAGIIYPDSGTLEVSGKVASILELGMGFDPELTGRDNIRSKCALYGFKERETDELMDSMVAFSELGEQIDHPLRTYSSGMVAKLAFSVLIHVKCDIMVIDEVLSVGDAGFNAKSRMVFDRLRREGKTVVIASHNTSTLENVCDRVVWLEAGKIRESGDPATVCYRFTVDAVDSPDVVWFMAESGDSASQHRLGVMLRDGISMEKDAEGARLWFERASEQGNTDAMVALGDMMAEDGMDGEARELYRRASEHGNVTASLRLISGTEEEKAIAAKLYEQIAVLADGGNYRAMKLLADVLSEGTACKADRAAAIERYKACAEHGDPQSCFLLGTIYRDGNGAPKDPEQSVRWFEQAFARGNIRAGTELANMYRRGIGVERDMESCVQWYTAVANRGDAQAMMQLGVIYRDGAGVEKDEEKSTYWLKRYSEQKILSSEVALGDMVKQGRYDGGREECLEWYIDAANRGNVTAMFNAAVTLRDGAASPIDTSGAAFWFKEAADHGNANACYEYAMMLMKGEGVPANHEEALTYMTRAANMGNARATHQAGLMYLRGAGTPKDPERASFYLERAAEFGNLEARCILDATRRGRRPDPIP